MLNFHYGRSGVLTVVMSGELNSLPGSGVAISNVDYDNSSGYVLTEIEFLGGQPQPYIAGTNFSVWFLRSVISGTYEDGASGFVPGRSPDVTIPLVSGSRRVTRMCRLPPETIRIAFFNNTISGTLAASGNILRLLPRTYEATSG